MIKVQKKEKKKKSISEYLSVTHYQAVYFCSGDLSPPEFHHYGLAAPVYTHFTSPIRRYAGIFENL